VNFSSSAVRKKPPSRFSKFHNLNSTNPRERGEDSPVRAAVAILGKKSLPRQVMVRCSIGRDFKAGSVAGESGGSRRLRRWRASEEIEATGPVFDPSTSTLRGPFHPMRVR
jgi:hypothetical protein